LKTSCQIFARLDWDIEDGETGNTHLTQPGQFGCSTQQQSEDYQCTWVISHVIEVTAESYNRRTISKVWQHPDKSEIGSLQFKVNRKETVGVCASVCETKHGVLW
jgi:hypothetical protein